MVKKKLNTTREVNLFLLKKYFKNKKGNLLNLGGGSDKYKDIFENFCKNYTVCDLSPQLPYIDKESIYELSYKDNSFDYIVCNQVLEHLEFPDIAIKEMYRVLKKNGMIIVTAPFMIGFHSDPQDYFRFTERGLTSVFVNNNFIVLKVSHYGNKFTALAEFFKFRFINPYNKKNNFIKSFIVRKIINLLFFIDNLFENRDEFFYTNVYGVFKK